MGRVLHKIEKGVYPKFCVNSKMILIVLKQPESLSVQNSGCIGTFK